MQKTKDLQMSKYRSKQSRNRKDTHPRRICRKRRRGTRKHNKQPTCKDAGFTDRKPVSRRRHHALQKETSHQSSKQAKHREKQSQKHKTGYKTEKT